jgi:[acyl-carrier-protein] S-malonyltransferase
VESAALWRGILWANVSAAAAAQTISADTARLLRLRVQAMQTAVPLGKERHGGNSGVGSGDVTTLAADAAGQVCQAANDNDQLR